MSIKNNGKCLLCDNSPETLIHLFCLCPQVAILWKEVENWIHFRTNIKVKLSVPEILFGYLKSDYFITCISRRALAREGDYEMMSVCACVRVCVS